MPNPNSRSGNGWAYIRVAGDQKSIKNLAARVTRAPEEIFVKYYYQKLTQIAFRARKLMIEIIERSETPTGRRRAARGGGESGRVDTGRMKSLVWARAHKVSTGKYRIEVGWLNDRPGYAIFQEHGTRGGIQAMNALKAASQYMAEESAKLGRGGSTYIRNTEWDWGAPLHSGETKSPPEWFVGN